MDVVNQLTPLLDQVLGLNGRAARLQRNSALLGAVPELDSMAVVALIGAIEERFGIAIDDDEIDGDVFATLGSLADFVDAKLTV